MFLSTKNKQKIGIKINDGKKFHSTFCGYVNIDMSLQIVETVLLF